MSSPARFLNSSEAAARLGVSTKALRLYEEGGLVVPDRTAAGWRAYGPDEMALAAEIVALRALGLSLAQVARVVGGDPHGLEPALAAHQASLEDRARQLAGVIDKVRGLRADLAQGRAPAAGELPRLLGPAAEPVLAFDLPWPWGGERFELRAIAAINYIIGPLGSGKTRFAMRVAATLPGAVFLGLERDAAAAQALLDADPARKSRVDRALAWLADEGAETSSALVALLAGIEADATAIVVDMVEQGLGQATQEALIAYLRQRAAGAPPLFLMTRSSVILDLGAVSAGETIILCPANHSPPMLVAPYPGAPGYEAVATCLASPEVRARTEGVIAWRPEVA